VYNDKTAQTWYFQVKEQLGMDIFSETLPVRFGNIDRSDTLTIASTFDLFQEAAISHAEILGVGRDAMKQTGRAWILSRLSVFMDRRPHFGETVTVRSWPRNWHKLFAVRDYDIRDGGDIPVIRGRSGWLILDLEKRRPLRPQAFMMQLPPNEGINALPLGEGGGEAPAGLETRIADGPIILTRQVAYSDIDYNGHMNNTRYIQWIQDLFEPELLEEAAQIRLDINYLSEARYGEKLVLAAAPIPREASPEDHSGQDYPARPAAAFAIEGRRDSNDPGPEQIVFRAELRTGHVK
jgi:acyl-ACP thioesterase